MLERYPALFSVVLLALTQTIAADDGITDASADVAVEPIAEEKTQVRDDFPSANISEENTEQADNGLVKLKLSSVDPEQQVVGQDNPPVKAPKQAENIDLKEVVEEPLKVSEPIETGTQTEGIDKTPTKIDKTGKIDETGTPAEESAEVMEPAENIDLKEVVEEPLRVNQPKVDSEKVIEQVDSPEDPQAQKVSAEEAAKVKESETKETAKASDGKQSEPEKGTIADPNNTAADSQIVDSPATDSPTVADEPGTSSTRGATADKDKSNNAVDEKAIADSDTAEDKKAGLLSKLAQEISGKEEKEQQKPLLLLNSEVLPGTSTRLGWSPSVSFIGISAPTAVLVLNGVKPGPTLCLTAAVHGDELNGIEVVRRVLYDIDPKELSGAVIGVPIVNLQGFRRSSRYLPDRRDLNRFFPGNPEESSAARIAYSFFSEVITHCDMLIDLHTGSFRRTNLPQLRADLNYPNVASLAEKMGAIVVVQSEGAIGSLRRAAVKQGIPSVTLEAGAPHELQKDAVEHGVKSIESAMDSLGMIKRRRFWERSAEPVYYKSTWVRAREGGILFSEVSLGARVKQGDLLGTVTDPITNVRSQIVSPFEGRVIGMALNQVMFPGFAAYHIGLKAAVEETPEGKVLVSENEDTQQPNIADDGTTTGDKLTTKAIDGSGDKASSSPVVDEIDPVVETETIENIMPPAEDSE